MTGRHYFTVQKKENAVTLYEKVKRIMYLIFNLLFNHSEYVLSRCRSQTELQKQKQETEQQTNRLTVVEKESEELKKSLTVSQNECKEVKQQYQALLEWKKEKETLINETEAVQKELTDKIGNLENSLSSLNETSDELKVRCSGAQYIPHILSRFRLLFK